MNSLIITSLAESEPIPYELLLWANPSIEAIEIYLPHSTILIIIQNPSSKTGFNANI